MTDEHNREWIIKNSKEILEGYYQGITLRQLYYRLVAIGMTNDLKHYKRVVAAMTAAVECDAVEPNKLADMCRQAINEHFDEGLYDELKELERQEKIEYKKALKEFVKDLDNEEVD